MVRNRNLIIFFICLIFIFPLFTLWRNSDSKETHKIYIKPADNESPDKEGQVSEDQPEDNDSPDKEGQVSEDQPEDNDSPDKEGQVSEDQPEEDEEGTQHIFFYKSGKYFKEDTVYECDDGDSVLLTSNKKYEDMADAIVFRMEYNQGCGVLKSHVKKVPYIVESLEPPYCLDDFKVFPHDKVDFVSTYRLDCGVTPLQSIFSWKSVDNDLLERMKDKIDFSLKDDKLPVFWAARNCKTRSGRENYMRKLTEHVGVSIYGSCLRNTPPSNKDQTRSGNIYLHPQEWADKHYFYFAAENSNCKDYVTEKYWKTLAAGLIPIVDGPDDYSAFLPSEKSVIRMDQYTPEELAEYLKYLVSNHTAYLEYMPWKTDPDFQYSDSFIELTSYGFHTGGAKRTCELKDLIKNGATAKTCAPTENSICKHGKWDKYKN
eukprot:TRINITY_DN202_c0_g1_i1.p1 TRINITY_DN202_c0_g1~~TRINITY_DN202_c0_g1_i1.p1  ORF type:complete len:430 (+),score=69.96 TRINITY_DN202_c0_g1_i1:12-1301(+)